MLGTSNFQYAYAWVKEGPVINLTERFGADAGRTARVVLWTTVLAFGSFMAAVGLLVP